MPPNMTSRFESAGIFPFNPDELQLHDIVASFVTDRPIEKENEQVLISLVPALSALQYIYSPPKGVKVLI
jgi:hypothetical protein